MLTVGISLYVSINNIMRGFYHPCNKETKKKTMLIGEVVGTIVFSITQIFIMDIKITNINEISKIILPTIIFFVVFITCQYIVFKISKNQANKEIK